MKKSISKVAVTIIAIAIGSYGCTKTHTAQEEHTALDKKDNAAIISIQSQSKNAVTYNNSLIIYHDSLAGSTNQSFSNHCTAMMHYYDNLYHQADSLCRVYQCGINNIHTCGMMSQCQSMMGNNGMMGGNNGTYHCSLMNYIVNNCNDEDNVRSSHTKYCTR
ncbi:MAG TPA: hypothetical protein VII99_15430 [Bacteroidia bacterium]